MRLATHEGNELMAHFNSDSSPSAALFLQQNLKGASQATLAQTKVRAGRLTPYLDLQKAQDQAGAEAPCLQQHRAGLAAAVRQLLVVGAVSVSCRAQQVLSH